MTTTTETTPTSPARELPAEVVTRTPVQDVALPGGGTLALVTLDNGKDHTRPNTFGPEGNDGCGILRQPQHNGGEGPKRSHTRHDITFRGAVATFSLGLRCSGMYNRARGANQPLCPPHRGAREDANVHQSDAVSR